MPSPTLFYDLPLALDKKASLALKGGGPLAVEGYILYIKLTYKRVSPCQLR